MSNPRDTGRYDAITDTWIDQQVKVDFAWGNIPMQPNDDRGMAQLDPELDSHIIATSGYEGFPAFITGGIFDDTIPNVEVPNLVGLVDPTAALNALDAVGLVLGDTNSSTTGATSGNDGKVKSQSPAAGTLLNEGGTVDIVVYDYVSPGNPIAGISTNSFPGHSAAAGGEVYMFLLGRTIKPTALSTISISGNTNTSLNRTWTVNTVEDNDSYNTGGTVCKLTANTAGVVANPNINSGGVWATV